MANKKTFVLKQLFVLKCMVTHKTLSARQSKLYFLHINENIMAKIFLYSKQQNIKNLRCV